MFCFCFRMQSGNRPAPTGVPPQLQKRMSTDEEDTMRNLRKTFAGIFGDM